VIEIVFNMSFSASLIVIALLVFRPLLKKLPGGLRAALWGMVAIRLLCPVFVESPFSLVPDVGVVSQSEVEEKDSPYITDMAAPDSFGESVAVVPSVPLAEHHPARERKPMSFLTIAEYVWVGGMVLMAAYFVIEYLRLKRRVSAGVEVKEGIKVCDDIQTSFIMGIITPVIYLPSWIDGRYSEMIIRHERMHISRYDHLQKVFGYFVLTVHWFNPFAWVAYMLFCKDIEFACDEKVIKDEPLAYKKQYATAILYGCTEKLGVSPYRVAFGEIGVKQRIKTVLKYKKVKVWLVVIGVAVAVAIGICFLTNPQSKGEKAPEAYQDSTSGAEVLSSVAGQEESLPSDVSTVMDESFADKDDTSTAPQEDTSTAPQEDTSTVPPEDVSTAPPQAKPVELYSVQKTHETPDYYGLNSSVQPAPNANRYLAYVKVKKCVYAEGGIQATAFTDKAVKVWLCDKQGNRIDYVYSNANGLVLFEVFPGEYTVVAEPVDGYFQGSATAFYYFYSVSFADKDRITEIRMYNEESYKAITQ